MTWTVETGVNSVEVNERAKYLGQGHSFKSYCSDTHTHTCTADRLLYTAVSNRNNVVAAAPSHVLPVVKRCSRRRQTSPPVPPPNDLDQTT